MEENGIWEKIAILIMVCMSGVVLSGAVQAATAPVEQWNKTFGGTGYDGAYAVQQTSDGGYILAGETKSFGVLNNNAWLIKTDSSGNEQWNKTFGGTGYDSAYAYAVQQTSDGGYILAGIINNNAWLIKTDSSGNEQWNKTFGGINYYYMANSVQQTFDGGYILAGGMESLGVGDSGAWLVKTDSSGNEQWNKTFGGKDNNYAYSVQQTSDGGYILAGDTKSYGTGKYDGWLIKTDPSGKEQWNKTFGGINDDYAYSVQQTSDGGYILTGGIDSLGTGYSYNAWLVKTDSSGNEKWNKTFGGKDNDHAYDVQQTFDGGYILAGISNMGAWLIKTDSSGNEQWNKTFDGISSNEACSVQQTSDGGYVLTGNTYGTSNFDAWLIKVSNETGIAPTATPTPTPSPTPIVTPTPTPSQKPTPTLKPTPTPVVTPIPNLPPVASFTYSPANPKAGEQVTFDASGSNDPDGKIVLYQWDWDGDGVYDENSNLPATIYWFTGPNTYTVNLRVTDDKGSTKVISKQVTVSKSAYSKSNAVLVSWYSSWYNWWNTLWFNQNHKDFAEIDKWLREKPSNSCASTNPQVHCWQVPSGSKPLDWLKGDSSLKYFEEADVINLLNQDIDHSKTPGLTYKQYAFSAMREEDIVNGAFKVGMSSYIPGVKILLGQFMPSLPGVALDAVKQVTEALLPTQPELFGFYTILNGVDIVLSVNDFKALGAQLNEAAYVQALGIYFGYVDGYCGLSATDQCLEDEFTSNSNELVGKLKLPPLSETDKTMTLTETKKYWKNLWRQYGNKGSINGDGGTEDHSGLYDNTRQDARNQVRAVIISALLKKESMVVLNREITHIASPGELRVYNSNGNVTGLVNGVAKEEIPYSLYDEEGKNVEVFGVSGSYRYEVKGTGTGVYGLHIDSLRNGTLVVFNATGIPMSLGQDHRYTIDWNALSKGEKGVTLAIDYDGNGIFDRTIKAGANLSDITPPEITIVTPTNGTSYILNQLVLANWQAIDNGSGINTATATVPKGTQINTATVGLKTFSVNAIDKAGNKANKTAAYSVIYSYSGVLPPFKSSKDSFKLGSTIPVKFSLTDAKGKYISTAKANIYLAKITNGVIGKEIAGTATDKATKSNQFRQEDKKFMFNLNTKPLSAGTWRIRIELDDGTSKYVNIELK